MILDKQDLGARPVAAQVAAGLRHGTGCGVGQRQLNDEARSLIAPIALGPDFTAVQIDNRLRTYDTQVYLFVLPLSVDPREVYTQNHQPGKTRVFVSVTPEASGFVFEPTKATLTIGAQRFTGAEGFEFGKWDGKWEHRPVGAQFALHEPGRRYLLSIDFVAPAPSPESRDIVLDLSQALRSQAHPPLPPIRFAPVRWKEGYT